MKARRRCQRHRRQAGVTLIELLVAVTLVSLLAVGILFAMRAGLTTMNTTQDRLAANRRVIGAQRVLDEQLANLIPAQVQCTGPGSPPALFFLGQPAAMRVGSSYSLEEAARGYARIVEYLVQPGERGVGVRLVMNEYLYTGPSSIAPLCASATPDGRTGTLSANLRPVQLGPRPFVIADKLRYCRFSYLVGDGRTNRKDWFTVFAGSLVPSAIRIDMAPLTPEPGRLQMASVTVPIRTNRNAAIYYFDIDPVPQP